MHIEKLTRSILPVLGAACLALGVPPSARADFTGGGKANSDCYVVYKGLTITSGSNKVECTDGDLACDTDGIDGSEDNAGALLDPDSLRRARDAGLDARALAAGNDAYGFFAGVGDLVVTGPTRTNVNDYRAILIL